MDFRLDEDQEALQQGIRAFCEGRLPVEQLADLEAKGGFDRGLWGDLAEMGVFSLSCAEADGGLGLGPVEAALVFVELGRRLVPGPLVWTHLAADQDAGAARGEVVYGGIDLSAPRDSGESPILLEHLAHLDALLVVRAAGVFRVETRGVRAEPVATPLDPLTPVHEVLVLPEGERLAVDPAALRLRGAALAAALLLGLAEASQELATAYAKQREQFGRPIGEFQAVKHLLADAYARQELARAAVYAAGAQLADPVAEGPARAVAAAKLLAGEAALANARTCIQVHGGMGYTWEVPAHLYLKRAWVLENGFGAGAEHASGLGRALREGHK